VTRIVLLTLLLGAIGADIPRPTDHTHLMNYLDAQGVEHPVKTPEDWAIRRKEILEGMQAAMGPLPDRSHLPPLDMKVTAEVKGEGFKRLTISYVLGAGSREQRVPAYLFIPDAAAAGKRLPGIIALHPTSKIGKGEAAGLGQPHGRYGIELAQRGYVVLCPDYPSFGDYACDFSDPAFASGTMLGIAGHMRGVDLLQSLPQVDPERIGAIGHSLGGHNAMFLAAFDPRVKVVVSSCGWTPFADYYGGNLTGWTSNRYMPRIKDVYHLDPKAVPFDFYEVAAALAPRPFFSNSPLRDANFDVKGVRKAEPEVRKVYQLLGAPDAFKVVHPDCAHDFPLDVREEAYRFIDSALKQ
jgi:dienelactone hydrolase